MASGEGVIGGVGPHDPPGFGLTRDGWSGGCDWCGEGGGAHIGHIFAKLNLTDSADYHRRVRAVLIYLRARDDSMPSAH
jgi:hypothetical protein